MDIPEDVMRAALRAIEGNGAVGWNVARAILAERKRCAEVARNYPPLVADGISLRAANQVDIANAIESGQ